MENINPKIEESDIVYQSDFVFIEIKDQASCEATLERLKEYSKNQLNGSNSKWIKNIIKFNKDMTLGIYESDPSAWNSHPSEIEDWEFEVAAVLANDICGNNNIKGEEVAIEVLTRYFFSLDLLEKFQPILMIGRLLTGALIVGLPQSFKQAEDIDIEDDSLIEKKANKIIDDAMALSETRDSYPTNLTLEQKLGLVGDISKDDFNAKIDKYLIYLFNQKEELGEKEFSRKVIEIYQTTDWCDGVDIEIPYEETEEDLKRYNLTLSEMHDCNMPDLASTAYRKLMHHFNDNLMKNYQVLINNKKSWEFKFDLEEEDIETIKDWKNGQIISHIYDLKEKYIDENYQEILEAIDLKKIIDQFYIENSFIKKEEIVYGTDSTSLEELEKLFKNDSYLIQIFGRAKHFIFDKYRKLDSSPKINFLGKKLKGKKLLSVFLQTGSNRILPEDCIKSGYENVEEFVQELEVAKEEFFGAKKYWPEYSKTNNVKSKIKKVVDKNIQEVNKTIPLKELESLISDKKRYYNNKILEIGDEFEYELDLKMYEDKADIEKIEFFDRNYEEIKNFIEENFSREFFNEIALERGYSIGKFKELSVSLFKGKYIRFSEDKKNQKLIPEFKKKDSDLKLICNHIEKNLGPITSVIEKRSSAINKKSKDDFNIYVLHLAPSLSNPHHTLITCGMSSHTSKGENAESNLEISIKLPKEWKLDSTSLKEENHNWPLKSLLETAFYPFYTGAYLDIWHSINCKGSLPSKWDYESTVVAPFLGLSDLKIPKKDKEKIVEFSILMPIYKEERELKLASSKDFTDRIWKERDNEIFLHKEKRESFAKDFKELENNNNEFNENENEDSNRIYIGLQNWIDNIFRRAKEEEMIRENLEAIKSTYEYIKKKKPHLISEKNKFSIDSICAVALQVSLNANQMVYQRGKEAAIEQLAKDILLEDIEVYTPDAIPLALEYVILLWGSEHLIPFGEVMNMRVKALRLSKVIGYKEQQSEINNERLFSSGKYILTKQNSEERINRLILKSRDFVNTNEEVFEGETDNDYPQEVYGAVVAVANAVLKEIEATQDEESVINVLATSLAGLIGSKIHVLIIWITYYALQEEVNFSSEEAGNLITKAKLESNIISSKQEEEFLKNIKLDDKTIFIKRLIWKVKFWFNWLTAKRRPAGFPASSLYRFKYLEPKSLYGGLSEEEVSLILEKAGGLDMHTTLISWANKTLSRGSIRNFNELVDEKDFQNIKNWLEILRTKYERGESRQIINFLLNAFIDALLFVYLPFFVYELSFIYTPLVILISALFLRPISSFYHCNTDVYFPLDLDTRIDLDNFSKSKKKKIYQSLGLSGYIIYFFLFKSISLNFIGFLLIFFSFIFLLYSNSLNIYIYKLRKYGLGEVLAEMTKARRSIGLPF